MVGPIPDRPVCQHAAAAPRLSAGLRVSVPVRRPRGQCRQRQRRDCVHAWITRLSAGQPAPRRRRATSSCSRPRQLAEHSATRRPGGSPSSSGAGGTAASRPSQTPSRRRPVQSCRRPSGPSGPITARPSAPVPGQHEPPGSGVPAANAPQVGGTLVRRSGPASAQLPYRAATAESAAPIPGYGRSPTFTRQDRPRSAPLGGRGRGPGAPAG